MTPIKLVLHDMLKTTGIKIKFWGGFTPSSSCSTVLSWRRERLILRNDTAGGAQVKKIQEGLRLVFAPF
ncbi:hypothetical protein TWF730_001673 [Orbilia blumenaviensis]|uniref:Uncharacterized protein n=1 Tax=Orbilia blumenaviensis TaxID=1796055 RepID=A0AAV9UMT3_9PEZI